MGDDLGDEGEKSLGGGGGGGEIEMGRKRAHFGSANATAGTADFGRRTATAAGQMSSSLFLLPSNLQFRSMNYLVLFVIYKIFLYPLGNNEKILVLFFVMNIFLLESLFWRFFLLAYGSVFGSRIWIECWFQRLQYEGGNGFSHIWLVTMISHIPLVLADHCASSIFWLQLWLHCWS